MKRITMSTSGPHSATRSFALTLYRNTPRGPERFFVLGAGIDGQACGGTTCLGGWVTLGGYRDCTGGRKAVRSWHFVVPGTHWRYCASPFTRMLFSIYWAPLSRFCLWIGRYTQP